MTREEIFGLIAVFISVVSGGIYITSIFRGKTKPHAFTWAIWSIIMGIVFVAQWRQGAGAGSWTAGVNACGCFTIFVLSLFKGEKNITKTDWLSLICALAIIPFWRVTQNALLAVVLATLIDAFAYYPTVRKTWLKPREENLSMYALSGIIWVFSLIAMNEYSLTTLIYPAFCMVANTSVALMIFSRRRLLLKSPETR